MKNKAPLILFLAAFIIVGTVITFMGAKDIYVKNILSRDWSEIEARYTKNEPYRPHEYRGKNARYWLYYSYVVDENEYTVTTDYITSSIPMPGSTETIKYDPNNPGNAIFTRQSANVPLFIAGLTFLVFPLTIIAAALKKAKVFFILFGAVFAMFGILFYSVDFPIILAVIFTAAGIAIIVKGIKTRKNEPEDVG